MRTSAPQFYIETSLWILLAACFLFGYSFFKTAAAAGNESNAFGLIAKINISQKKYAESNQGRFAKSIRELGISIERTDENIFVSDEYIFEMKVYEPNPYKPAFFSITANPLINSGINKSGDLHFYYDSTLGSIKVTTENRDARADDPSI